MNALPQSRIRELRGPVLRAVSRSFYLSIRLLPAKLREPIGLAYLLARATDTLADTAAVERSIRLARLRDLAAAIQGQRSIAQDECESFAESAPEEGERILLRAIPDCLAWLESLPADDRADIRAVLLKINEGQRLDLERLGDPSKVVALADAGELDRYIYLVAGAVGEFWTAICLRHLPRFSARSAEEMRSLGVAYGKGLQLINILRDVGSDLRAGRCYLPAGELQARGVSPDELMGEPARALPVLDTWRVRAEQGITAGIRYASSIRSTRVRVATALPALIGARTLVVLRDAGPGVFERKVKVPRREVRRIMLKVIGSMVSSRSLRRAFEDLSS